MALRHPRWLQEFEKVKGREVRYGMIIQLQHVVSDKYLAVARQARPRACPVAPRPIGHAPTVRASRRFRRPRRTVKIGESK